MVEFNTLPKEDQKIICELLDKTLKGRGYTDSDIENFSIDGNQYMIDPLTSHFKRLGYDEEINHE